MNRVLGTSVQIVGDNLFTTQVDRLQKGVDLKAANAILITVNQVGTLTETFEALALARRHGYRTIVSARSGESEDTTIAHLAVGWDAGQLKVGSFSRSERMAKWNEVLRIEESLGRDAVFSGWSALPFKTPSIPAAQAASPGNSQ